MKRSLAIALIGAVWGLGAIGIHAWSQEGKTKQDAETAATAEKLSAETGITSEDDQTAQDAPGEGEDEADQERIEQDAQVAAVVHLLSLEAAELKEMVDTVWTLVAAFLVFFMNAGFGCVEAGFCRSKNTVNILGKNFVVFGISSLAFWLIGFAIMFGDGNSLLGYSGWFVSGEENFESSLGWTGIPLLAKFFFQLVFAGTAATIVSGCVAERIHYKSYMLFTIFLVGISYAITGHWIWGGSCLD